MVNRYLFTTLICLLMSAAAMAQDCLQWGDRARAVKFLEENKPNGTAADPECVNRAFSTLAKDKSNVEVFIGLLDFERSLEKDHSLKGVSSKYPAVGALVSIGQPAVPRLLKAIKETSSELVRTNAASALEGMYRTCEKQLVDKLESEAAKPETLPEQQERLREAEKYIEERHVASSCKS